MHYCGAVDGAAVGDGEGGDDGGGGGGVCEGEGDVAVGEGCVGELEMVSFVLLRSCSGTE